MQGCHLQGGITACSMAGTLQSSTPPPHGGLSKPASNDCGHNPMGLLRQACQEAPPGVCTGVAGLAPVRKDKCMHVSSRSVGLLSACIHIHTCMCQASLQVPALKTGSNNGTAECSGQLLCNLSFMHTEDLHLYRIPHAWVRRLQGWSAIALAVRHLATQHRCSSLQG